MDRQKVLIVDDDADIRRTLHAVLEKFCAVLDAPGGAEALRLLRTERPALVLLDMVMPGMDGMEVLRAIRMLEPSIIVVMLTGEQEIEVAEKALILGAAAYITKPFDVEYLRSEVRRRLGLERQEPTDPAGRPWRVAPDDKR